MRIALFNAQGLSGKDGEILEFSHSQHIDVFCIVETWLSPLKTTVIRNPCVNLTQETTRLITGGRRSPGGILVFTAPNYQGHARVAFTDPTNHFVILKISDLFLAVGYFPPSLQDAAVIAAIETVLEFAGGIDCIFMGDFNARMGAFSGDRIMTTRGRQLFNFLAESPITFWKPEVGRFTSYGNGGAGVTDLVLTSGIRPLELTIHEGNSLGGSDHRPLTFSVNTRAPPPRAFERWNVRKLADPEVQERYRLLLEAAWPEYMARMIGTEGIDDCWKCIKDWIAQAALGSCGRLSYRSSANAAFWTPELLERKRGLLALTVELQQVQASPHTPQILRSAANRALTQKSKEYRELLQERTTELFQEMAQNMGQPQNAAAFMRMVKNTQSRRARTGCQLDPEKIEVHANHFRQTFGLPPTGEAVELPQEEPFVPTTFTWAEVEARTQEIALGKAAGTDGIMAEFYRYGGETMVTMLHYLMNKIGASGRVPSEWREALITLAFKHKGSDQEAKNYRPIALTCVARRLYERLLLTRLHPFTAQLSDFQGGFRPRRSTLDQCVALAEIMLNRPELQQVFLDFRAAYDLVNRKWLWARLLAHFGVPASLVDLLRDLFDSNSSVVIIGGSRSLPIRNLRGLLQGSSLSPDLFNFFVNELLDLLRAPGTPKVTTATIRTNNLTFADDINMHALLPRQLQTLLNIAELWSIRVGMEFAPEKCYVFANSITEPLTLLGTALPARDSIKYLGINFTVDGIDYAANTLERSAKARAATMMLSNIGMNLTGFPQSASARLYKTFIRPTMEYGLQLKVLAKPQLQLLQRAQNLALRSIFSARRSTSTNVLHKLLLVESMQLRNQVLNIKMVGRLLNSQDSSIPAVNLVWGRLGERKVGSFPHNAQRNPLWTGATLINHLVVRRSRGPHIPSPTYSKAAIKGLIMSEIGALDRGAANVAGVIEVLPSQQRHRHLLQPYAFSTRQERVSVLKWITGGVANHSICLNCHGPQQELSRQHAVACSGAGEMLKLLYRRFINDLGPGTTIDQLLNHFAHRAPPPELYSHVHQAISLIYSRCLGFQQALNGFWKAPEADPDDPAPRHAPQREPHHNQPDGAAANDQQGPGQGPRGPTAAQHAPGNRPVTPMDPHAPLDCANQLLLTLIVGNNLNMASVGSSRHPPITVTVDPLRSPPNFTQSRLVPSLGASAIVQDRGGASAKAQSDIFATSTKHMRATCAQRYPENYPGRLAWRRPFSGGESPSLSSSTRSDRNENFSRWKAQASPAQGCLRYSVGLRELRVDVGVGFFFIFGREMKSYVITPESMMSAELPRSLLPTFWNAVLPAFPIPGDQWDPGDQWEPGQRHYRNIRTLAST